MGLFGLFGKKKETPKAPPLSEEEIKRREAEADRLFNEAIAAGEAGDQARQLALFVQSAQMGDITAMFNCGVMYSTGSGTAVDKAKALSWYEKAAERGHAKAQFNCGNMYNRGEGTAADKKKALEWYKKAAEQGHAGAQFNSGIAYYNGHGTKVDKVKALHYFELAAEQGDADAQHNCGLLYLNGDGVATNKDKARQWFEKAAAQGQADAKKELEKLSAEKKAGDPFDGENEFDKILGEIDQELEQTKEADRLFNEAVAADKSGDYVRALKLYLRAAELGSAAAMCNCGLMYDVGKGTPVDKTKAFYWYEKAAQQGDVSAQYNCGNAYYNGSGTAKDLAKAFYWYEKAAQQGHAKSQFNCGILYSNGKVTPVDKKKALEWYKKAAEQGHAGAQLNLGVMYFDGDGTEKDLTKAHYWYEKAAEQGHAGAQFNLGLMYERGNGVTADRDKSRQWLGKAAAQGHEDAKKELEKLDAEKKEKPKKTGGLFDDDDELDELLREVEEETKQKGKEKYEKAMALYRAGNYGEALPLLEQLRDFFGQYKGQYLPDAWVAKGWMYENGKGTEAQPDEAYRCYRIAAQNGERDGKAGMVRLTVCKDGISVEDCQTALCYVKELNDGKLNALVPALEKKLAEAQLRESMADWELTEKNVQAIFERCLAKKETPFEETYFSVLFQKDYGYDKDSTPVTFSIEKIKQNKKIVAYLFGELPSVHTGRYIMDSKESIHKYDGKIWTTNTAKLMMLYHLGEATGMMGPFIKKYNSANIYDNRVKPTLSPKDPAFPEWWEKHKAEWEGCFEQAAAQGHADAKKELEKLSAEKKAGYPFDGKDEFDKVLGETGKELDQTKEAERLFDEAIATGKAGNHVRELELYLRAAELGSVTAMFNCGVMYANGQGAAEDKVKALYWFEKAAEQGHAGAQFNCGVMYNNGEGTAVNMEKALYWLEKAAEQGNAKTQFHCGNMYLMGEGTAVNMEKALYWFEKAAEQGDVTAQFNCGNMYRMGKGTVVDETRALYWFEKAAEQGDAEAQCYCGIMYSNGMGTVVDKMKALYWYKKAAEQGNVQAQFNCGLMYYSGEGTAVDKTKSLYWFEKAAEQDVVDAQYNCGVMYLNGEGTEADEVKAMYWYEKAAEQGEPRAQYELGAKYFRENDFVKAKMWLEKAAPQIQNDDQKKNIQNMLDLIKVDSIWRN